MLEFNHYCVLVTPLTVLSWSKNLAKLGSDECPIVLLPSAAWNLTVETGPDCLTKPAVDGGFSDGGLKLGGVSDGNDGAESVGGATLVILGASVVGGGVAVGVVDVENWLSSSNCARALS